VSDSYQAVYDAVRSRLGNCDIGSAVESAIRDASLSHYVEQAAHSIAEAAGIAASAYQRPSVLYRPAIMLDGNQWCALYGENLQDGVAGFGDSPALAMKNFDANWDRLTAPQA
jgi:hypothetical protein